MALGERVARPQDEWRILKEIYSIILNNDDNHSKSGTLEGHNRILRFHHNTGPVEMVVSISSVYGA